ncbi:MAG: GUN4 domain-containing protein [Elainellaceae cyanobacterium]
MTPPQNPQPSPNIPEQVAQVLLKYASSLLGLTATGFGLRYLILHQILESVIAFAFATTAGLMNSYGDGLMRILKNWVNQVGEANARWFTQLADRKLERPAQFHFQKEYQEALKVDCYLIEVEGHQLAETLALEDVFIPLRIRQDVWSEAKGNGEIWNFLPKQETSSGQFPYRRIVVLANPGYGKTTLLRHLTLIYVTEGFEQYGTRDFMPVLLRLREIHSLLIEEQLPRLSDLIVQHLRNKPRFRALNPSSAWFESYLEQGKCLVMLDGLDEVPKSQRSKVRHWVNREMEAYRQTQFILTSRPHGFEIQPDKPDIPIDVNLKLEVLDFNPDQKQLFVERWYQAIVRRKWETASDDSLARTEGRHLSSDPVNHRIQDEADEYITDLMKQIVNSPALNELARNPLLLTMIAVTHRAKTYLPKRKVELYETITNLLLGTRPYYKKTHLTLTASENKVLLQVIAFNLMQSEQTRFSPDEGASWIQATLIRCRKDRKLSVAEFFEEIKDTAGLLVEKELGFYEFAHKTFQEYFAALYVRELKEEGETFLVEKLLVESWEEVICFYAALGNASNLINAALEQTTPYTLKLAKRCRDEGREVDPEVSERLASQLLGKTFHSAGGIGIGGSMNLSSFTAEITLENRFQNLIPITDEIGISDYTRWGEYQLFLNDQAEKQFHSWAEDRHITIEQNDQLVTDLRWEDARWFCAWLSTQTNLAPDDGVYDYRLPTPEELTAVGANGRSPLQTHKPPLSNAPTPLPHAESPLQTHEPPLHPWTSDPDRPGNALCVVRQRIPERYRELVNYLANGRWKEADQETLNVMLEVTNQKEQGYLSLESLRNFPCDDLRIIDQLWVKFSGGKFGFSVQKDIWVEVGGKLDFGEDEDAARQAYRKMSDINGWRKDGEYISYEAVTFDTSAPLGHLPFCGVFWGAFVGLFVGVVFVWVFRSSLASKLVKCKL